MIAQKVKVLLLVSVLAVLPLNLALPSDLCPPLSKAQWIITRISKGTFTVKSLKPLKPFNACQINTNEGETFFLSADGKKIIEGMLLNVPTPKLSERDYKIIKSNVLFYAGRGKKLLLIATNPLCEACRAHRKEIKDFLLKYRIGFIPVGFKKEEEFAAIDAFCRRKRLKDFFNVPKRWKLCDNGKLKVWTVEDVFKKYGITGTPVFIFPDGTIKLGIGKQ